MVSFYVNKVDDDKTSFMKLGGFDEAGFVSDQERGTMQTENILSWALLMTETIFKFGDEELIFIDQNEKS
jgi:hypothetical protein